MCCECIVRELNYHDFRRIAIVHEDIRRLFVISAFLLATYLGDGVLLFLMR